MLRTWQSAPNRSANTIWGAKRCVCALKSVGKRKKAHYYSENGLTNRIFGQLSGEKFHETVDKNR